MALVFEELDFQKTPLGEISLRRRSEPRLDGKILYEVKLGDDFLMSSLFTETEIQLSRLGFAALDGSELDIAVGGVGLGYTAVVALEDPSVRTLMVIEVMEPVIDWHRRGSLVPLGEKLTSDLRCRLIHADFFELAVNHNGLDREDPDKRVHSVLLDIDHSPSHWLNSGNNAFYTEQGLQNLSGKLHPGGVFGTMVQRYPYTSGESANTVYLASKNK